MTSLPAGQVGMVDPVYGEPKGKLCPECADWDREPTP